ncbi:MAG TPA: hypothetical protein EYP58_00645, partial [bacterium (Candidatus Stahlbacteria)]|nr:hypothetical protein [Candidatus Stahlbacteria bacterium]
FWKWRIFDFLPFFSWWKREIHPACRYITAEIQPPVIGMTFRRIYEKTQDQRFLRKYLSKIQKYFDYLRRERDPDKDHLVSIITPMESGMDYAPQFDLPFGNHQHSPKQLKSRITKMLKLYHRLRWRLEDIFESGIFDFEDVAFNTIYLLSLEDLTDLWSIVDKSKAEELAELCRVVKEEILRKFWDERDGIFYGVYHREGEEIKSRVKTVSSLFPICLDIPDKYIDCLVSHIQDEGEFWLPFPIPSVARDEPAFGPLANTRHIWRGTTWINTNWFIARGLLRNNRIEIYQKLKRKTLELVDKSGFCEFYDPFDGHPGRAEQNFGWSTLAVDL